MTNSVEKKMKIRKECRRLFIRDVSELEVLLNVDRPKADLVKVSWELLQAKRNELEVLDKEVCELMLDSATETELENELENQEIYVRKFIVLKVKYNELFENYMNINTNRAITQKCNSNVREVTDNIQSRFDIEDFQIDPDVNKLLKKNLANTTFQNEKLDISNLFDQTKIELRFLETLADKYSTTDSVQITSAVGGFRLSENMVGLGDKSRWWEQARLIHEDPTAWTFAKKTCADVEMNGEYKKKLVESTLLNFGGDDMWQLNNVFKCKRTIWMIAWTF